MIDRWTIAEELWSWGEDDVYLAALEMSDEQMVRLWVLAGKRYLAAAGAPREPQALAPVPRQLRRPRSSYSRASGAR